MKRVQAIVSGKKKQCTKLPAPTTPVTKGKKEDSNLFKKPDVPPKKKDKKQIKDQSNASSLAASSSSTTTSTSAASGVASSSSSSAPQPSSSSLSSSTTTAPTTTTSVADSVVSSTSGVTHGVTNKTSGARNDSKIPATPLKKTKDSEKPEMKEKTRKDSTASTSDGKSKSKSFLVRRLSSSSKDKQRKPVEMRKRSTSDTNRSTDGSSGGYNSSGCEADDSKKKPLPIRSDLEVDSQGSVGNVSSTSTLTPQSSLRGIPSDISSNASSSQGTLRAGENGSVASGAVNNGGMRRSGSSVTASTGHYPNGGVRRHASMGGPHDRRNGSVSSDNSGPTSNPHMGHRYNNTNHSNNSLHDRAMYNNHHHQDPNRAIYANVPHNRPPHHPHQPGRPYYNADPNAYPVGYGSLPRSRSTTPTPESSSMYNYRSLPRRSNSSTPTPQSGHPAYNNNIYYSNNNTASSSGSLSRISETGSLSDHYPHPHYSHHPRPGNAVSSNSINNYDPHYNTGYKHPHHHIPQQPPRPGSVPPHSTSSNGPDSIYSLARPFSVTPDEQLERQRQQQYQQYPSQKSRAGSVPLGYESETAAGYSSGDGLRSSGSSSRNYESDSGYDLHGSSSGLRVQPGDEMYRSGPGKKPVPRRHTLGSSKGQAKETETERKRDAFMTLLAKRYPQYADRIQGGIPASSQAPTGGAPPPKGMAPVEKPARSRDPQRRRAGPAVVYDPRQATNTFEYEDLGTMSDLELPSFQRGGFTRTSLPIVRSASTSLERPLGLIFLVYGSQTKKSLLPNELTTLDTVRAMFVRAFPDLTMEMMELPRKKIYVLDPATNIYFQLEDLGEVKDRSVLKLHETDDGIPQKVRERQEIRGRTVQVPLSRAQSHQDNPEYSNKSHTLPAHATPGYSDQDQWNARDRARSRTPEPMERQRYPHSPEGFTPADRSAGGGSLNPIPENRQVHPRYRDPSGGNGVNNANGNNNYYETIGGPHSPNSNYSRGGYPAQPQPQSHYDRENPYAIYAAPPQQQAYIARSTRASTMAHPQRAIGPPSQPDSRDGSRGANPSTSRHSPAFAHGQQNNGGEPIYQRSQSYRPPATEKDVEFTRSSSTAPEDHFTRNRIEKMEQQLASLTAWVHYQKSDLPGGGVHRNESMKGPRSVGSTTSDSSDTFPASSASKYSEETSPTSISSLPPTNHVVYATPTTTTTQGLSDIHDGQRPMIGISNNNATISPVSPPPPLTPPSSSPAAATTITSQALSAPPAGAPTSASTVIPMVPADIGNQVTKLKSDLQVLRRQTQLNVEAMREEFMKAANSIKVVISSVPGAENQVNFHNRVEATKRKTAYLSDKVHVDQELGDLESSVEELRYDILNHQCRVQLSDVEGMALLLSNITKNLADLKAQFPEVQGKMTDVMKSEMILVKAEENFLIEEPSKIEKSLMRCKKLTGTLYTLKRLASVQDHHPPQIPNIVTSTASSAGTTEEDPKKTLLENIRALVPDHDRRVQKLEAREAARQRMKKLSTQKDALKFGKSLEMASKGLRPCSTSDDRQQEGVEVTEPVVTASNEGVQEAPMVVSSQNTISANPTPLHNNYFGAQGAPVTSSSAISSTGSSSSRPTVTFSDPPSSSLPPSSSSTPYSSNTEVPLSSSSGPAIKPFSSSYSASLSTTSTTVSGNSNKQASEKPTATVSAMPAHTSVSTNLQSPPKHTHVDNNSNTVVIPSSTSNVKSASIPLTEMTERLSSQVQAGTGPATHSVSTGTDSSKKSDASVSTTSSTASATTSSFRPPVFTKPPRQFSPAKTSTFTRAAPLVETEDFDINVKERPKSSGAPYPTSPNSKTPPISKANSLDSSPTKPYRPLSTSSVDTNGRLNGHAAHDNNNSSKDEDKVNKPYRKAARSAFSSAWVSPPSSPTPVTSPKTNPLPLQTINSMAQITPGGTINLVLSGVASPKSPTNPGTFTITPPTDITTDSTPNPSTPSCTPTSATVSPKSDSDTPSKQKKVPPPPPPRKGSRPTSMTSVDLNGAEQQQQLQEQQEMPQFVGGILGQHRLSGGPLSSTPKPASQQKALSTFEKDLASGIYANLNRPEFQSQNTSPQQLIDKANSNKKANNGNAVNVQANVNPNGEPSGPLAPMVSSNCIDRTERGSSSESTSSSNSGTSSMGSQQSVAGVMRSASVNLRSSSGTKPKPEPPKRHSSLLSKSPITPPDTRVPTRRKTLNGVDL